MSDARYWIVQPEALILSLRTGSVIRIIDGIPPEHDIRNYGFNPQEQHFYIVTATADTDLSEAQDISSATVEVEELTGLSGGEGDD